ncbi:MAG: BatD family protein, partial [Chloroflexi bacterium]|nr:BatD family protein [Chloroflexota bacterium]
TFADPEWQMGPQWRAFDSQSATNTQSQDGKLAGTRSINQVLVPTMSGKFTIPAIHFSFFDPQSASYQTISTNPIHLNVESDGQPLTPVVIEDDPTMIPSVGHIRPIKDSPQSNSIPSLLTQKVGFWSLWTLPLILLVGQYGWHKRKQYLMNNPQAKQSQKAAKKAYQALKKIDINSSDYYNSVGRVLTTYISDKLNRSVAGLTQAELSGLMLAQGVNNDLVEQVRTCLTISEMGQYAPIHQMNTKEVHLETKSLIAELEKVL